MPHISRRPLNKNLLKEITDELWWVLTNIKSDNEMATFIGDLLTPTERIMLAKRFTLACLIMRGWGWQDISNLLRVSSATINRMQNWLDGRGSGFRKALEKLEKKKRWEDFWSRVDDLLPELPKSKSDMKGRAKLFYGK